MKQRDQLLDFIKGLAIIAVIFIHNIKDPVLEDSYYWFYLGQAVPMFMMVSGYLGYQKYSKTDQLIVTKSELMKVIHAVWVPFMFITVLQIVGRLYLGTFKIESLIEYAGMGPGSYYPWVFIQAVMIIPIIVFITKKYSKIYQSAAILIGISILFNVLLTYLDFPKDLYRIFILRYLLYLYLGCLWRKHGLKWSVFTLLLVLLSATFAYVQIYEKMNFTPYVFNSWRSFSWLTAPYTIGIILVVQAFYHHLKHTRLTFIICYLGQHSYFVFLTQLLVFSLFKRRYLDFISNPSQKDFIYILLTFVLCVAPLAIKWAHTYRESNDMNEVKLLYRKII